MIPSLSLLVHADNITVINSHSEKQKPLSINVFFESYFN